MQDILVESEQGSHLEPFKFSHDLKTDYGIPVQKYPLKKRWGIQVYKRVILKFK